MNVWENSGSKGVTVLAARLGCCVHTTRMPNTKTGLGENKRVKLIAALPPTSGHVLVQKRDIRKTKYVVGDNRRPFKEI